MRFASLGSGSRGNATLIESGSTCVLLDCGFSVRETERRLARLDRTASDIDAVVVTHEHSDHISGVAALSRRFDLPVWATLGTATRGALRELAKLRIFTAHESFAIGDIEVAPYPVPHDAREPCQFTFDNGAQRLGVLTDTGCITAHIVEQLTDCAALMLECNHDEEMLRASRYPQPLKERIAGRFGHLSNGQSAQLLEAVNTRSLQHLVAVHLSEQNNKPELARSALSDTLGCTPDWIDVADQSEGIGWRNIS